MYMYMTAAVTIGIVLAYLSFFIGTMFGDEPLSKEHNMFFLGFIILGILLSAVAWDIRK